ncbi:cytochrome b/b6 domain-containing protein [Streptomyces sp. VRA16 Mangrove soil]|uniref:cytochrome b/b6 domain-containing protein n=1 Tax=Streptomyces sp. VRA16 Mangrove soil TaxID=2817434 RepID=UPI0027DC0E62|nr:cytochrome b/b6 domain-containing protein [Streptomyces sp. VRA16 Mangrove soil]
MVTGSDAFRAALDFGAGVLSLVSLTASVVWGLVASDTLFLTSRQRLLSQAVHRTTAVASLGFLLLHISVKLALSHVTLIGALIPFGNGVTGSNGLIGLGVLAGLLMITTGITGALRSSMASPARLAARWRATHMLAYPAWCFALLHGLNAGRPAKAYVIVLYSLSLLVVAGAVGLRAAPRPVKAKVAVRVLAFLDRDRLGRARPVRAERTDRTEPTGRAERDTRTVRAPGPDDFTAEFAQPAPEIPARPAPAASDAGFAAAYRAVSATPRAEAATESLPYVQTTPYVDALDPLESVESVPTQRWPAPSPPPPMEAPPSAYDPAYDTPYGGVPTYEAAYGGAYGTDATSQDAGAHGAPTEPLPGPFQPPSSGEPWSTPYGGTQ